MALRTSVQRQRGGVAVEFALVFMIFMAAVLAMIDFTRWLFAMNSVVQATREAARTAVVCDKASTAYITRAQPFLALAQGGTLSRDFYRNGAIDNSCTESNCEGVEVSATNYTITAYAPFLGPSLTLPQASTYLPRESMKSSTNPNCS